MKSSSSAFRWIKYTPYNIYIIHMCAFMYYIRRLLTTIRLCTTSSSTSKFNSMRINAPAKPESSMALSAPIISSGVACRCYFQWRSSTYRSARSFGLCETTAPFHTAHENITVNVSIEDIPLNVYTYTYTCIYMHTYVYVIYVRMPFN